MGKSCGTVGGDKFSCLDDVGKLKVTKNSNGIVIDGGPWGKLELPCLDVEWQELLTLKLFLEFGKSVDVYHLEKLLEEKNKNT